MRLALGADRGDVAWMITKQGLRMTGLGTLIGLGFALGVAPMLGGSLSRATPFDVRVFGGAAVIVLTVSLVASHIPGRRALDPMNALRSE